MGRYMFTVNDIANWFLKNTENVTNKKLQKLTYYAYAWYLTFNNDSENELNNRFFENKFEAWVHGCVYPSLYDDYKQYGTSDIPKYEGALAPFSKDDLDVLNQVNEVYGHFNGNELESICHSETPWKNARAGIPCYEPSHALISDKDIFLCYASRLNG